MDATVRLIARCLGLLAVAGFLLGRLTPVHAQPAADPVENLRQTLQISLTDLPERDAQTKACLGELRSLSELRKAVVLREWRHRHPNAELAAIDQVNRDALAERFRQATRQVLSGNDAGSILAALEMLNQTAASMSAIGEPPTLTRPLTSQVAALVGGSDPAIRAAAARTLGQMDPDITIALPVLASLVKSNEPALRFDAAGALGQMLEVTAQPWTATQFNPNAQLDRSATAEAAAKLLPLVGTAAADPVREVRSRGLTALTLAATLLGKTMSHSRGEVADPRDTELGLRRLEAERNEVRPLLVALQGQLIAAGRCLRERDTETKMLALNVFEATGAARLSWLHHAPVTLKAGQPPDDPLAGVLATTLPSLAATLNDGDVKVRRKTLDVLESYGPLAAAAAPAVALVLKDPADSDRFVRWSAVRTLGVIGEASRPAVPVLMKIMLQDPDLDVRLAAASVLQALDPTGQGLPKTTNQQPNEAAPRSTLPALIRSLNNDQTEMRLVAIQGLAAMGTNARPAVPALAVAVRDADPRVRLAAIRALGAMGTAAQSSVGALRQAMKDEDPEVRRAAGDALLNLERGP